MRKRIIAMLIAIALVCGMIVVPTSAAVEATYNGTLSVAGTGLETYDSGATRMYLHGTDTYLNGNDVETWTGTDRRMHADVTDANSGIFVDGTKQADGTLIKLKGTSNLYWAEGFSAVAGNLITIKGTFYTENGETAITFTEASFKYTDNRWADFVGLKKYSGSLTIEGAVDANNSLSAMSLKGTDQYLIEKTTEDWTTDESILKADASDANSGIFVGGTKQSDARLIKFVGASNFYWAEGFTAVSGDIVTIKGTFYSLDGRAAVELQESSFKYNGSKWEDYEAIGTYTGKLTIEGSAGASSSLTSMLLKGTDNYLIDKTTEEWVDGSARLSADPADVNSGIFVGTEKQSSGLLIKYIGASNSYYAESFTATAGDIVTIKGTFYSQDGKASVTYEESKFKYDGSKWVDYVEVKSYGGSLSIEGAVDANSNLTNISLKGTDEYLIGKTNEDWTSNEAILKADVSDADGGVFVGSTKQSDARLIKFVGANNYYWVESFTATVGDIVTIKGTFYSQDGKASVAFTEAQFIYDGGKWTAYVAAPTPDEENVTLTLDSETSNGGNQNGIYLFTEDGFPVDVTWAESVLAMADEDSGVFYNDEKIPAVLKRYDTGKVYVGLVDGGVTAKDGDKVVVKGMFTLNDYIVSYKEITLYYNGQVWALEYKKPVKVTYTDITLDSLHEVSRYRTDVNRWDLYMTTKGKLPGEIDQIRFSDIKVSVDGTEYTTGAFHAFDDTLFVVLENSILPQKLTKDTKVIIKAGKYNSDHVTKGISIKEDYVLYVNQYGISDEGFLRAVVPNQTNVKVSIDREIIYGGDGNGMYLLTDDKFPVDASWSASIRAVAYDDNSGVFINDKKVDAVLKKFQDGKIYVGIADAGITAQDGDKLVIQGLFKLGDYAVSYASHTFYYNGKTWNTTYFEQQEEYTNVSGTHVSEVSWFDDKAGRWNIYIDVDTKLPGEIDKIYFDGLEVTVNGKSLGKLAVWHSHEGKLYVPIPDEYLPKDAENGMEIVVKAGKAMGSDRVHGIVWTKDFTFYTFMGALTDEKPTTNTKYLEVSDISLFKTSTYRKEWEVWQVFVAVKENFVTKNGTVFYKLPIEINGKTHYVNATQSGTNLYFDVTKDMISPDAKNGTLTIKAGATAIANAGKNGVRINDTLTIYLFNQTWSEKQYTSVTTIACNLIGVQDSTYVVNEDGYAFTNVYVWTDTKMPGTPWYEAYLVPVLYNGEQITVQMEKVVSTFGRLMYFGLSGTPKEGDIVSFKAGTEAVAGGLGFTISNDYSLQYRNGLWSEYVKSDVKAPADDKSLWEVARFDSAYIPFTKNGVVTYSNTDRYNVIQSMEPMKDYTISFTARKLEDNAETLPNFYLMLRANAIDDETPISKTALYGYILSFQYGQLSLFKNNENWELIDTYRLSYEPLEKDEKFFEFGVDYEYEVSIYNVTETCVCITFSVNGVEQIRYYDHASDDPKDPVVNAGDFRIYAECATAISDDVAETEKILTSADECETNKGVYVAASYPYVAEDTELTVDGANATIEDGVFKATKAGTYTISGTYKGEPVASTTIVVTEAEKKDDVQDEVIYEEIVVINWPVAIALAACAVAVIAVVTVLIVKKRKKKKIGGEINNEENKLD